MGRIIDQAFNSSSDLRLWFKQQSGDRLLLTDISRIIPLRWEYFRDNWDFIKKSLEKRIANYQFPDFLRRQIEDFTTFIEQRRNISNTEINPFSDTDVLLRFYAIFDNIEVNSIQLTKEEREIVESATRKVNRFTRTDFVNIRADLIAAREEISDVVDASDDDYNRVKGRSSISSQRDISIRDVLGQQQYFQSIFAVDYILANSGSIPTVTIDPFALARQNANNPDINIQTGRSGRLVRMNFGESLQSLAKKYLDDEDRWVEIAIANGLRPPYVDEIGFSLPMQSNGSGAQISIYAKDTSGKSNREKFYVGQVIFLQSNTIVQPEQRNIISIKEIPVSGDIILEVDGADDLDRFQTANNATVRVFTVNTINSNFFVLIPSQDEVVGAVQGDTPFFLRSAKEDEKRQGVDLLINDNKDLVFTSFDDLGINFGVGNALQAMQLKLEIPKGSVPRHPQFGLVNVIGQRTKNVGEQQQQIVDDLETAINADPRFDRIETLNVRYNNSNGEASSFLISISVRLAGTGTVVPITFTVTKE